MTWPAGARAARARQRGEDRSASCGSRRPAPGDRHRGARPGPVRTGRPRRGTAAARGGRRQRRGLGGALLRSTAAVHDAPAALERYERHRAATSPTGSGRPRPGLQAVHVELLAADRPVREGLRFEATSLVGRDEDIRALRAAVRRGAGDLDLGPGGLGKTRLAHLLGREAEQPVVHFVELVGVGSPEDVVGEVGSALGVRDSVSGRGSSPPSSATTSARGSRRSSTRRRRLLILDNCEHVVAAVADLVAYLVATCQPAAGVTTTGHRWRSPPSGSSRWASSARTPRPTCSAAGVGGPPGRRTRRRRGTPRRTPPRRAAAGHRARRGQGAGDVGRGHRPPARRPVRAAARRRPSAPDRHQTLSRRHRLVVEPAHRGRAAGAPLAVGLPRRLLAGRRRGCSAATRSSWSSRWSTSRC